MLEGNCRVTTINPLGQCEIVDFGTGDVWYFPRGHGHSIQGLGPDTCAFLLVFDNGYFSEFGTFSITDWLGHVPAVYIKGTGRMTVFGSHGRARTDEFSASDVGYMPQGYGHYIENTGSGDLEVMAVFNNGSYERSPSPPGWPPIPIFCFPPISACRKASSPSSPKTW